MTSDDHGTDDHHGHDHHEEEDHGHDHHKEEDHSNHGDGNHSHHGDEGHSHHHAHDAETVGVAVLTVSTSRALDDDPSGDAIVELVESAETAEPVERDLVEDSPEAIEAALRGFVDTESVDAIVTTGGTGITDDDVTPDVLAALVDTELPGFGELFRRKSEAEIGTRVIATRATAGLVDDVLVFALPGSENAARLGTAEVILPDLSHFVGLARQ